MSTLAEQYRPASFVDVVGQDKAVTLLKYYLGRGSGCALMLLGPSGSGKTTLAMCAAREWGCDDMSTTLVSSAESDVGSIRELAEHMSYRGWGESGRKCYIIDEIHTLSARAADRLLSVLESIPPHVLLIATTTESTWLEQRETLWSRWHRIGLAKPRSGDVAALLQKIADAEKLPNDANGWADRYVKYNGLNLRNLINGLPEHLLQPA